MKQKIIFISFSILLLLVLTAVSFAKEIEKDNSVKKQVSKVDKKEQTVQKTDINSKENTTKSDAQTKTTPNEDKVQVIKDFPPITSSTMSGEQINWQVISSGGIRGTSTNFILSSTIGQTAVGIGTSTNFQLHSGFWQTFDSPSCCISSDHSHDSSTKPDKPAPPDPLPAAKPSGLRKNYTSPYT